MVPPAVLALLADQSGVIARRQAIARGMPAPAIRRAVRRREWAPVHPGIYVDHTGPPSWLQRAWAGVLSAGGRAALCGVSAMRAAEGPGRRDADDEIIHVAVDRHRRLALPDTVRLHRLVRLEERVLWNLGPPRLRYDDAALDVALAVVDDDPLEALSLLATSCQSRRTTARRLAVVLAERNRVPQRSWLASVLEDIAEGTCSVLERGYATKVERAHGLPRPLRQVPGIASTGLVYRDVEHGEQVVELDGRLFHNTARQRDRDFERDLDLAVEGRGSIRLSYGQVYGRSCSTAGKVGVLLTAQGWGGQARPCEPGCVAPQLHQDGLDARARLIVVTR